MKFALISTVFIRWSWNFPWLSRITIRNVRILLINLQQWLEKLLFRRRSEVIFFRKLFFYFCKLVNKIRKNSMSIVLNHVKLQLKRIKTLEIGAKCERIIKMCLIIYLFNSRNRKCIHWCNCSTVWTLIACLLLTMTMFPHFHCLDMFSSSSLFCWEIPSMRKITVILFRCTHLYWLPFNAAANCWLNNIN